MQLHSMRPAAVLLMLLFFLPVPAPAREGSGKIALVCTYDYRKALAEGGLTRPESDSPVPLYFLSAETAEDGPCLEEFPDFGSLMDATSTGRDLLVFVHGLRSSLPELLPRFERIADSADLDIVLFLWPANERRIGNIRNFEACLRNVRKTAPRFQEAMLETERFAREHANERNTTLMFNSLGNLFAREYARGLCAREHPGRVYANILINAAAVPARGHAGWSDSLSTLCRQGIYVICNGKDEVLKGAALLESAPMLGQGPGPEPAGHAEYIDLTPVLRPVRGIRPTHNYYFERQAQANPTVRNLYRRLLHGKKPEPSRSLILREPRFWTAVE